MYLTNQQKLFITRSYLSQPLKAEAEVNRLIDCRNELREQAMSPRSATYGVDGHNGGTLSQEVYVTKLEQIESDLGKAIDRWLEVLNDETREIESLDLDDANFLCARYITGLSLAEMEPIFGLKTRALILGCNRAALKFFDKFLDRTDDADDNMLTTFGSASEIAEGGEKDE